MVSLLQVAKSAELTQKGWLPIVRANYQTIGGPVLLSHQDGRLAQLWADGSMSLLGNVAMLEGHGGASANAAVKRETMRYRDGQFVELGDRVTLAAHGNPATVVGIIHDGLYADGYEKADWDYLGHGIILSTELGDLRLDGPDEDMELISRRKDD